MKIGNNEIISTSSGHVFKKAGKSRPFIICRKGRMVAFKTLEAAAEAQATDVSESSAWAKEIRDFCERVPDTENAENLK